MSGKVLTLSRPIMAHGEEIAEITLREPTTKDAIAVGQPFLIVVGDDETAMRIENKTIASYIVRLAGIPRSSVETLSLADFGAAQAVVLGFFGAADGELPSNLKAPLLS